MKEVFIISVARTPIGSFGGSLSTLSAIALGSAAIKGAIQKSSVNVDKITELYFGNVVSANLGQAPAKQAAIGAGLLPSTQCTTVNKVCSSGMKAIMFGAQSIQLGFSELVMTGGMESMSNIPYYLPNTRWGMKYGSGDVIDGLQKDGLTDAYNRKAMGAFADATATKYDISREAQDEYAVSSYQKSAATTANGKFKDEIVPIEIPQKKGEPLVIIEDEEFKKVDFNKIPGLKPAFSPDGSVTAANASTMNDGASALLLASEWAVKEYGLKPIARIVSFADAEQEPEWFTTAPTLATPTALKRANKTINDIDYFEVNEAFSVVPIAFSKILDINPEKMNIHGGAVSLGHPLGSSGSRIVCSLTQILVQQNAQIGLATICNGGGGASAMIIERV